MSQNATATFNFDDMLTLEKLGLSTSTSYPAFIFGALAYLLILLFNLLVLLSIIVNKKLHKPMFILLFNLPISDMVGATAFFPHLMFSIVTKNRLISYNGCIIQAFLIHFYGTANLLILSAMAYDRYTAICCPLRYNAVMTSHTLVKIITIIWFMNVAIMGTLIALLPRLRICRTDIVDLYCNNPSLVKLACSDTSINNYYGMFFIVFLQGGSLLVIMYTYAQILRTCVKTKQSEAKRKAVQTCGSHLVVFLILQLNTIITLSAHRIQSISPYMRRALGVSILVFPPILDPIIYGLNTRELKTAIFMFLRRKVS